MHEQIAHRASQREKNISQIDNRLNSSELHRVAEIFGMSHEDAMALESDLQHETFKAFCENRLPESFCDLMNGLTLE